MEKKRIKNTTAHFWVTQETADLVRKIADGKNVPMSAAYRELIEKGLIAGGYRTGGQDLTAMVRQAVQETVQPQVERLAAIGAKGTQISAAAFFLAAYNGKRELPPYLQEEYDELMTRARKLGIEYLKARDKSLDEFIGKALGRMEDSL